MKTFPIMAVVAVALLLAACATSAPRCCILSDRKPQTGGIAPANPAAGIFFADQDPNEPPIQFCLDVGSRMTYAEEKR